MCFQHRQCRRTIFTDDSYRDQEQGRAKYLNTDNKTKWRLAKNAPGAAGHVALEKVAPLAPEQILKRQLSRHGSVQ